MVEIDSDKSENPQKERIREITARLFADKGYRAVGVAEIGDAVGLARGALYYHIGSKEDLLYDIVIRYIRDLVQKGRDIVKASQDPHDRIIRLSRYLMATIAGNLPELTVCFREADALTGKRHNEVARLHQEYQDIWAKVLNEGAEDGIFRELQPVALKGILGMYFYSFLWLNPKGHRSSDDIADIFADIVFRAVDNDKPTKKKKSRIP